MACSESIEEDFVVVKYIPAAFKMENKWQTPVYRNMMSSFLLTSVRHAVSFQCFFFIIFQILSIERFSLSECYKHNRIFKCSSHMTT